MGWKRNQFERRLRELLAGYYAPKRVYVTAEELEKDLENDQGYSLTDLWRILLKSWTAGRAMDKSIPAIQDEAENWLKKIGIQRARVVSQAFLDTKIGHRISIIKSEGCRMEIANHSLNQSDVENELIYNDMVGWSTDQTIECSDILNTTPVNANHVLLEWSENGNILEDLWSLYKSGLMTQQDRGVLKSIVAEITNANCQRVEEWISYKESDGQE